jgi:Fic family protein
MSNFEPKITLDLNKLQSHDWFLLGEIQSKIHHLMLTPLDENTRNTLSNIYLAKGVSATTAIEGNTLTEKQVNEILTQNAPFPKSQQYLKQEVLNIKETLDKVKDTLEVPLSIELLNSWNTEILKNLELPEEIVSGEIRKHSVHAGAYFPPEPNRCEILLQKLCQEYNAFPVDFLGGNEIALAIIKAIFAHVILVLIHPFGDGNGRTSRLIEARTLMVAAVPFMSSQLLSNFYNKTRTKYIEELSKIWQRPDNHLYSFISYALQGLADEMREQITTINKEIILKVLENDIYTEFKKNDSVVSKRQRNLALFFLKNVGYTYCVEDLWNEPKIFRLYEGKTSKSLVKDLNILVKDQYIKNVSQLEPILKYGEAKYCINLERSIKKFPDRHLNKSTKK